MQRTIKIVRVIEYFLRSCSEAKCVAKVTGKRCNQGDEKGLIVARSLEVTGLKKFDSILKQQLDLMKSSRLKYRCYCCC